MINNFALYKLSPQIDIPEYMSEPLPLDSGDSCNTKGNFIQWFKFWVNFKQNVIYGLII